ncbi:ATP-dependent zinc protease [Pseudobacteriovorax antillogorgiicola]|uniref:Uncharacterized conserved protein n=1 Tax=Pseudobacteriovorax antillogorgiicola TaxID=1513793 RepID=A0A1Y6CX82_9BACT|nr:ATP-dependent zinc protease [Pseudobacteriovorax antillogorgiicola]TCS42122.1 hypothetical protein EDD56_14413 [Pseudobacteriovorax antillogorgiicola]SMF83000.1 Uncharacterized conserved protein [Pseudobacteriovorax antillogorgiicola]
MKKEKMVIGWREWVQLPDLGIKSIKAKIDTGARTSSLHAFDVETFKRREIEYVRFKVHPKQKDSKFTVKCEARILEYRLVKSSTGHSSERPVIITEIHMLGKAWDIELTLANRDEMGFRMLLGREGMRERLIVDPGKSFYGGQPVKKSLKTTRAIKK